MYTTNLTERATTDIAVAITKLGNPTEQKGYSATLSVRTPAGTFFPSLFINANSDPLSPKSYRLSLPSQSNEKTGRWVQRAFIPEPIRDFAIRSYIDMVEGTYPIVIEHIAFRPFREPGKIKGFLDVRTNYGSIDSIKLGLADNDDGTQTVYVMDPDFWDGTANIPAGIKLSLRMKQMLAEEGAKALGLVIVEDKEVVLV
jgi:hypothetical protein